MRALAVVLVLTLMAPARASADDCGLEPGAFEPPPERAAASRARVAPGTPMIQRLGRAGALAGKTVYVSAGHGWVWDASLGRWRTQRGNTHGLVEDFVSAETVAQHLIPVLHDMGAYVVPVREASMQTALAITDDADGGFAVDGPAPSAAIADGWARPPATITDGLNPFDGGGSVEIPTDPDGGTTATWTLEVPAPGDYEVYVAWVQGPDRASDAHYVVRHGGGESHLRVDQRRHGSTWVLLGRWYFDGAGSIALVNDGDGGVVSADAVRIGGGMGRIDRGGGVSGRPAFEEGARYAAQWNGAPSTVWDYSSEDGNDDVGTRSRFAAWDHEEGEDAVYVAWHTNAPSPARGTSSFAYGPEPYGDLSQFSGVPGSLELMDAIHTQLVEDLRAGWDPDWQDRGQHTAYFGEVNPSHNPEMPSVLIEVAFHDTLEDADALREPGFRDLAARAIALGIARYFAARDGLPAPAPLPEPSPTARVRDRQVLAAPGSIVYLSPDGLGFDDGTVVAGSVLELPDGQGPWFARVSAVNATGASRPGPMVGAHGHSPRILLVDGFHALTAEQALREDLSAYSLGVVERMVLDRMNDGRTIGRHGRALADAGHGFEIGAAFLIDGFDDYRALIWAGGEAAPADLDEDEVWRSFLDDGGAVIYSGTRAGELDTLPLWATATTVSTDAEATSATGVAGGLYDGLAVDFGDDGPGGYDADEPDAFDGPAVLTYPDGTAAAIHADHLVILGFPVETVGDPAVRRELYARALAAAGIEPDVLPEDPEDEDLHGGCGCASSGAGGAPSALLLLALAFMLRPPWKRHSSSSRIRSSARSPRSPGSISAATRRR